MSGRSVLKALAGVLAAVIILSVASQIVVSLQDGASSKATPPPSPTLTLPAGDLQSDVAFVADLLARVHPDPIPAFPLQDVQADLQALRASFEVPMSPVGLYRRLGPIVASIGDDHVRLHPPLPDSSALARFPVAVQFIEGRLYATQAPSTASGAVDSTIASGTEIVAINGLPAATLRDSLLSYVAGTRQAQRLYRLQEQFGRLLYAAYGWTAPYEITVRPPRAASTSQRVLRSHTRQTRPATPFQWERIGPHTICFTYTRFKDPDDRFEPFLEELFDVLRRDDITHLIIDIRGNPGGSARYGDQVLRYLADRPFRQLTRSDITVSREVRAEFMSHVPGYLRWVPLEYVHPTLRPLWMNGVGETGTITFERINPHPPAQRFTGRVTLLIGPGTMSSASLFAATVRTLGIGRLVGRTAGGFATHYGNVIETHLPASGLRITMPTSVNYGHSTGPIVPDHRMPARPEDIAAGADRALEAALQRHAIQAHGNGTCRAE
jgi:hypothetical protein